MKVNHTWLRTGAFLGASGIVLGALAAHALKVQLNPNQLTSFETAVRYQMVMAMFFLLASLMPLKETWHKPLLIVAVAGTLLFSGSIYLLSMQDAWAINVRFLGPITPLGGLGMIAAWTLLPFSIRR